MTLELKSSELSFTQDKIDLIKSTVCKGASNEEFNLFIHACLRTGLDPFMRQIYAVFRKEKKPDGTWGRAMTIQTGIDGYRLIAERTKNYSPGKETTFHYDTNGSLVSATAFVKKRTEDGTWHDISATAFYDEYVQTSRNPENGQDVPTKFWFKMRHTMLAKCAESLALRRAFPAELSGVYTTEEMKQADADREQEIINVEDFQHKIKLILDNISPSDKEVAAKCIESYKETFAKVNPKSWSQIFEKFLDKAINQKEKFYDLIMDWQSKHVSANA